MFELFLLPAAVRFLEALTDDAERREVTRLLNILAQDPYHDGRNKLPLQIPPVTISMYHTGEFKIAYHMVGNTRVRVFAIAYQGQKLELH